MKSTSPRSCTLAMMKRNAVSLLAGCALWAAFMASAATRYVNLNNLSPASPYTNWVTAATNIQDAVDTAAAGDEIVVTNGAYQTGARDVYGMSNRVAVTKPVAVRSVNGPTVTSIIGSGPNGPAAVRCVYLTNAAVLAGFTLTNGATQTSGDVLTNQSGGGVWCELPLSALVSNCVLAGNSARYGGGACNATLNNCSLSANSAIEGGGVIGWAYVPTPVCAVLNNCTLSGNSASQRGGGAAGTSLNNCTLMANSAYEGGGAFGGALSNCVLTGNSATRGGGTYAGNIENCMFTGNSASQGGGGAHAGILNNCTLSGNSARDNGGGATGGYLNNCTLTGNSAPYGGGVASAQVINCIVYYNSSPRNDSENFDCFELNYCCTTPLPTSGTGNFTNAPLFVNLAGGNLSLQSNSPCIDAGTNLTGLVSTDILGLPRPMDGDGDGIARFDIGAIEFNPYRFEPTLHLSANGFQFTVSGEPGRSVRIERSRDLVNWEFVSQVPIPACGQTLIDPAATSESKLFYRAIRVP